MNEAGARPRLRVRVSGAVDPHVIAPAIRSRLAGGDWPAGAERDLADAVVAAYESERGPEGREGATWP